ncbi:MAG: hypothetical protein Kow0029_11810 [Candidatus Rifleibacteriota bacterium]
MKFYKIGILFVLSMILLFFVGCGEKENPPKTSDNVGLSQASRKSVESASTTGEQLQKIKFKDAQGNEVFVYKKYSDHEKLEINFAGVNVVLKARANEKGRVKYKEASDSGEKELVAEVKYKDEGFKLVDANERLLFKVKFKDGKVKIADNEEMNLPYELKKKNDSKIEIRDKASKEIGNIKFYPDKGKLKVKDSSEKEVIISKDLKLSYAPGVILFEEIPLKLRFVIISELIKKGF